MGEEGEGELGGEGEKVQGERRQGERRQGGRARGKGAGCASPRRPAGARSCSARHATQLSLVRQRKATRCIPPNNVHTQMLI